MLRINHDNFDALLICMVPPALECTVELETIIIELLLPVTIIHDAYDLTVQGSPRTSDMGPRTPDRAPLSQPVGIRHGTHTPPWPTPTIDIWWWPSLDSRPVQTCSFEGLVEDLSGRDIWCWPLKHVRFASGQYTSYWNSFFC